MLLFVLGEGGGFNPADLTAPLSALSSIGFAVWYSWYVTTVAMPKMLESHREERKAAADQHADSVHELLMEMKEQRLQFTAWMTARLDRDKC